ncbi:alkaline phosphatase family protein [Thiohalocapsa marina]|uniref:Alkaline phosphatase family protein n=1 Tax=Thiohalocapsa marina TaxID=424902 RepID=A0A5M8FN30_9GAMM|nr:alkaline phosphatase family protein [Thiohalocapsa marina]KAA6186298.1 alkaline phosphatase family protein [Thiohalocapsa marina]
MTDNDDTLPLVLAGPILRRITRDRLTLWMALREPVRLRLELDCEQSVLHRLQCDPAAAEDRGAGTCRLIRAGRQLHYLLLDLPLTRPLPEDRWIGYRLALQPLDPPEQPWQDWRDWAPDLCYPGRSSPGFVLVSRVESLLHGSCRKPHHPGGDGLVQADRLLARCSAARPGVETDAREAAAAADIPPAWPALLVMSGDQVYMDDVAGPMLRAIHALVHRLGLPDEALEGAEESGVYDAQSLYRHPHGYYRRERLLPRHRRNLALLEILFGGVEKPVFTTNSAHNHLITLGEMLAMYLLVWSPAAWTGIRLDPPPGLTAAECELFGQERHAIEALRADLPAVRRTLAHLPVAMIFDDHDITDDWNLSREWEEVAYGHPFSTRVIGNALLAYLVNQAWGNRPEAFPDDLMDRLQQALAVPGGPSHADCIRRLLSFGDWHYDWPTSPPLVVMDSRTHRWRSESAARKPSGLLDWEALTALQQTLLGHRAVLLVSPAPIFGVKLIEAIQRLFTWFGLPLMVDAENWMAHPGAAHAMLNIFRHPRTPQTFVVLSGDVHYSFVYDVELRGRVRGPDIWQICSSGVRNAFPPRLLAVLDHANRWLYSPRSPFNWFTRRRRMRVVPRKPQGTPRGRRLLNGSGIGLVELDAEGVPWRIRELLADGRMPAFVRREGESHWS